MSLDVGIVRQHVVVRVARHDDGLVHVDGAVAAGLVVAKAVRLPGDLEKPGVNRLPACGGLTRAPRAREMVDCELGGIRVRSGRFSNGLSGDSFQLPSSPRRCRSTNRFDRIRFDTNASTSPEFGSIATSAPRRSPNAASAVSAARCRATASGCRRRLALALQCANGAAAGIDFDVPGRRWCHAVPARTKARCRPCRYSRSPCSSPFRPSRRSARCPLSLMRLMWKPTTCEATSPNGSYVEQARFDVDAWEAVAIHREARDLLVGELRADRQAFSSSIPRAACGTAGGRVCIVDDLGQLVDRFVQIPTRDGVISSVYAE